MAIDQSAADVLTPIPIATLPGCKRDGTQFEGDYYTDNQWNRFYRDLPRKIGGYRSISAQIPEICRGMHVYNLSGKVYTHSGSANLLTRFTINMNAIVSATTDRTPAGFAASANNQWQFDTITDASTLDVYLLAHAAPNAMDITDDTETDVYYGNATTGAILTATGSTAVSGGVVSLHPFIFTYGNGGVVNVSAANDPTSFPDAFRITSSKIVKGLPLRAGAGNGPSGLFWSLDSVIRATFVGGTTQFNFDTLSSQSSILSAASVIEDDGIFFWAGVDRFLMFNGVLRRVRNTMNEDFFFNNLNWTYRNKVFSFKVPRFNEWWVCFPKGSATECNHAVVLRTDTLDRPEPVWFDTPLPDGGRSAAQYAQVFTRPLMTGVDVNGISGLYDLWQHEYGVDKVTSAGDVLAIDAYFTTADLCLRAPRPDLGIPLGAQGLLSSVNIERFEPDFVQTGNMTLQAIGRWNPRAAAFYGEEITYSASGEETVPYRFEAGLVRFTFRSNTAGGDYIMGRPLVHVKASGNTRVNP